MTIKPLKNAGTAKAANKTISVEDKLWDFIDYGKYIYIELK